MDIHLIGIGGVGMAGLAVLLKRRGHRVSGCDAHASPRTEWLAAQGIPVAIGHDPAHVAAADLAIATPAVPADHPERLAAKRLRSRGEILARLVGEAPDSIAVCGSHGKTTTATWIARLLIALGESVEWAIGGETGDFPVAGGRGGGAAPTVLVVEADESDGTLAEYRAKTLVVTNCEYDHPDHFKTFADYVACYDAARANARSVVEGEAVVASEMTRAEARAYGTEPWFLALAPHNRQNALVAATVARRRGHDAAAIAAALPDVVAELPDRRFQKLAAGVYTDYAHHPTEMACAVTMARAVATGKLRVLFQPHRYSRTKALLDRFPAAFAGADEVVLCPVYAAFEKPVEGGSSADLYAACRAAANGPRYYLARSCEEAWEHASRSAAPGDVTLILGAGDIIRLAPVVDANFRSRQDEEGSVPTGRDQKIASTKIWDEEGSVPTGRDQKIASTKIWIGAGTNTWRSDLDLAVAYVKSESPAGRPGAECVRAHPGLMPWMAGIPGTLGGWVKMNAGAFGHAISEVIDAVKIDGAWVPASACGFAYRHSDITGEIQDVKWKVEAVPKCGGAEVPKCGGAEATGDAALLPRHGESEEYYLSKRKKFPPNTKGSVFRNPPGDFAGRLLEAVGAKDLRVGGAYVWPEHANVIVAGEGATASDFLALAEIMHDRVLFRLGIDLVPEVQGLHATTKKENT